MKVTLQFLKKENACIDGIQKFEKVFSGLAELKDVILYGIKSKDGINLDYCSWLIVRKMTYKQKIQYAVYAAEQVLHLFEREYPNDKGPRQAIKAAKEVLKNNSIKNRNTAYSAAWAAEAAAWAAEAAAWAAEAAAWAESFDKGWIKMKCKILKYGLKIIYKNGK